MWRLFTSLILELDLCKLHCKCLQLNVAVCRQPTHHKLLTIHVHSRIRLSEGRWAAERPTSIWKISNCGFLPAWHPGPEESFAALQLAQIIVRHQTTFLHSAVILYIYQYITTAGGEKLKFRIFSQKQRASHVCSICVVSLWYQLESLNLWQDYCSVTPSNPTCNSNLLWGLKRLCIYESGTNTFEWSLK